LERIQKLTIWGFKVKLSSEGVKGNFFRNYSTIASSEKSHSALFLFHK